jgi:uncharacterized membrane protein YdbT with pleckstrin-like domain
VAYPDNLLADGEQVVRHLNPHWIRLAVPVLVFVLTMAIGGFLLSYAAHTGLSSLPVTPVRLGIVAVAVYVLGWFALAPTVRWRSTHYVITTRRILIRVGVLTHRGRDIPLQRINDVAFRQSLLDRIIGAGTLVVESAGELGQERLYDVPHADRVQQLLNRLVEQDAASRWAPGVSDRLS